MKALYFLNYYVRGLIRKYLFELSPETYRHYYLKQTLKKAQKRFPYYHQKKNFDAISKIDKASFLAHFKDLNAFKLDYATCLERGLSQEKTRKFLPEPEGYSIGLSSGTSGKRGVFITTEKEQLKWAANLFTHLSWFSFAKSYRIGFILRANSPMYEKVSTSKRVNFTFFDLMIPFDTMMTKLQNYNPNVIVAPSYILSEIASYKASHPDSFSKVKTIVSVADVLDEELKKRLKEIFFCPIHEIYQATEGFLASTCSHETLHLNEDLLCFEEIIIEKNSHRFTPVITDYFRESQPIIRYQLDDILISSSQKCPCGSKRKSLLRIEGRSDEVLSFGEIRIFPDYIRNCVQNALEDQRDFCVIRNENFLTIKISGEENFLLKEKILVNFSELFTKLHITTITIDVEFGFLRDFSHKRKRVFTATHDLRGKAHP